MHDYRSVGGLYSKTAFSMPADNVHGLTDENYLNIIAYLLEANGLPAGRQDLKNYPPMMKVMTFLANTSANRANEKASTGVRTASSIAGAYYTEQQAERGEAYFHGSCSLCHAAHLSQARVS